jgi:hypothetical protein
MLLGIVRCGPSSQASSGTTVLCSKNLAENQVIAGAYRLAPNASIEVRFFLTSVGGIEKCCSRTAAGHRCNYAARF